MIARAEIERIKAEAVSRLQRRIDKSAGSSWPVVAAPPITANLLGRHAELMTAIEAMRSGESLCILGLGGIGKTQLALHALRIALENRPIIWIGVDLLSGSASIADALIAGAQRAGIEIRDGRPLLDEARACVVFDGIERLGAEQSDTLVIATSQTTMPQLRFDKELRLGPLDEGSSIDLLVGDVDPSAHDPAIPQLLEIADGHPLTLRIIAALIRHFGSARVVADHLAQRGAEALAAPRRQRQSEQTSLIHCLELALLPARDGREAAPLVHRGQPGWIAAWSA